MKFLKSTVAIIALLVIGSADAKAIKKTPTQPMPATKPTQNIPTATPLKKELADMNTVDMIKSAIKDYDNISNVIDKQSLTNSTNAFNAHIPKIIQSIMVANITNQEKIDLLESIDPNGNILTKDLQLIEDTYQNLINDFYIQREKTIKTLQTKTNGESTED